MYKFETFEIEISLFSIVALGCPDLKVPQGAWVRTDGLTASIHCNQSEETWYLTCRGNKWEGKYENCSSGKSMHYVTK